MKKGFKILVATVALTVAMVTPVLATESTVAAETDMLNKKMGGFVGDISTLVSFDDNCGVPAVLAMDTLVDTGRSDVFKSNVAEQINFYNYLQACIGNAIETERVKQQNVGALADLCKVNPGFKAQYDAAVAEYNKAVADHAAAEQLLADAKAHFAQYNAQVIANGNAAKAADAQAGIANN